LLAGLAWASDPNAALELAGLLAWERVLLALEYLREEVVHLVPAEALLLQLADRMSFLLDSGWDADGAGVGPNEALGLAAE